MKVSRRWVYTQAVTIIRARDLLPGANRHGVPKQTTEQQLVKLDFIRMLFFLVFYLGAGIVLGKRPRAIGKSGNRRKCSCIRKAGIGRQQDGRSAFVDAKRIGLVLPIEVMSARTNGLIGVLGRLVIGKKEGNFFVNQTTLRVIHHSGEKARHPPNDMSLLLFGALN